LVDASGRAGTWRLSARHELNDETTATVTAAIAVDRRRLSSHVSLGSSGSTQPDSGRHRPVARRRNPSPDFGDVLACRTVDLDATLAARFRAQCHGLAERARSAWARSRATATRRRASMPRLWRSSALVVEGRGARAEARGSLSFDARADRHTVGGRQRSLRGDARHPRTLAACRGATAVGYLSGGVKHHGSTST